jgi:release factor glutamine methyltransferase
MTVLEVIQRSADYLASKGVDSPRLQIELLLAHVLGAPRLKLYLEFERLLRDEELGALRALVRRRANREPLQQILGSASFCGLEIRVNRHVLVPRPETELLAERAWTFLNDRLEEGGTGPVLRVLDFGTGSGCLAIAVATRCSRAFVWAVDVSEAAAAVAADNVARHRLQDRIRLVAGDGFAPLPPDAVFELIVSNPPYIPTAELAVLPPEVRDYEPRIALDGGADGLDVLRRLAAGGARFLSPTGRLMVELGAGQADRARRLFGEHRWRVEAVERDYAGHERILVASRQ